MWVRVTDPDWFSFLSRADVDEVNFWQPSARAPFARLEPGAPFLFKLKRPFNHIAAELLEHFVWASDQQVPHITEEHRAAIMAEVADIAIPHCGGSITRSIPTSATDLS